MPATLEDFKRAIASMKAQDVPEPYRFIVHPDSVYHSLLRKAGYKVDVDYECQESVAYILPQDDHIQG